MSKVIRLRADSSGEVSTGDYIAVTEDAVTHRIPAGVMAAAGWRPGNGALGVEYPFVDDEARVATALQAVVAFKLALTEAGRRAAWDRLTVEERATMVGQLSIDERASFGVDD